MPTPNERLRRERQLRGWSQVYLAEQIRVPDYYISRWERGDVLPSPYYQQKLCEVFGKTAEELGMLQTKGDTFLNRRPETSDSPITSTHVDQLPFPQEHSSFQLLHTSPVPPAFIEVSTSVPSSPIQKLEQRQPVQKAKFLILLALVFFVLAGAGLGTFLLTRTNPTTANSVVGHLYFLSSGQVIEGSNQGIADEVQLELQSLQAPSNGKSYFAWLLPDENAPENQVILLGKITVIGGAGHASYSNPQYTNLLAITSRLLITEQDATPIPLTPSTDTSDWRYVAEIPQIPAGDHYSLLNHLRHLLANDPKLNAHHLPGGLSIWLYRNMQTIYGWSISARDAWHADKTVNVSMIRQDVIRILDYLDGIPYVGKDVPPTFVPQVFVDSRIGQIGLLEFDAQQDPPAYLPHIVLHLTGLAASPGADTSMREHIARILTAMSTLNELLKQVRQDARQLVTMTNDQLLQQQALLLLNDMTTNTNFALNGKTDLITGNMQGGVEWIYQAIQSLTIMNITIYRE